MRAASASAAATSSTILRREPLRGLVDEQQAVLVDERAGERHHLLLAARERAGALVAAGDEVGEEPGDELAARPRVALGEAQVLGDGEAAEDLAVLGHVADAALHDAVRGHPSMRVPPRRTVPRASMSPRIDLIVEVLPTPLRPRSAVTPSRAPRRTTSSTTCWPAMRPLRPATREDRRRSDAASQRLPEVGGLHGRVRHDGLRGVDGEQLAVVHDRDAVDEAEHDVHVVLDHEHGAARRGGARG